MPRPAKKSPPRTGPRAAKGLALRLTEEEHRALVEAAERESLPVGLWARRLLLAAAKT